jgi:hypothetical protein
VNFPPKPLGFETQHLPGFEPQPLFPLMTDEQQAIVDLTIQNAALKRELEQLKKVQLHAEIKMSSVGVPNGFEDGNSWDDYSFGERVSILCDMYERARISARPTSPSGL